MLKIVLLTLLLVPSLSFAFNKKAKAPPVVVTPPKVDVPVVDYANPPTEFKSACDATTSAANSLYSSASSDCLQKAARTLVDEAKTKVCWGTVSQADFKLDSVKLQEACRAPAAAAPIAAVPTAPVTVSPPKIYVPAAPRTRQQAVQ